MTQTIALDDALSEPAPAPPAPLGRILLLAGAALLGGSGLAYCLSHAGLERQTGYVQARSRTVAAPCAGRLRAVHVAEGKTVVPGTPLFELSDAELQARLERQQREIAALEAELAQVHAKAQVEISWRKQTLEAELFETRLKAAHFQVLAESHRGVKDMAVGGWQALRPQDAFDVDPDAIEMLLFTRDKEKEHHRRKEGKTHGDEEEENADSNDEAEPVEADTATVESPVSPEATLCDERLKQLETRLAELPANILEALGVKVVEARLEEARGQLVRLEAAQQAQVVKAEAHGTVGVYQHAAGEHVAAHEPIVELLDEDRPYLLLPIPSRRVSAYAPGTKLTLLFPGGIRRQGRVEEIPPQVAAIDGEKDGSETRVAVVVAPSGALWPRVPFGTTVTVLR